VEESAVEGIAIVDEKVPESPSLAPDAEIAVSQVGHKRTGSSSTSRIILTWVSLSCS